MYIASHALGRGHASCDLDELHNDKHCNPHQLQASPKSHNNGERVTEDVRADGFRRCPTLLLDGLGEVLQIYNISIIGCAIGTFVLTTPSKVGEKYDTDLEADNVHYKVSKVIRSHTIMYPRAMATMLG